MSSASSSRGELHPLSKAFLARSKGFGDPATQSLADIRARNDESVKKTRTDVYNQFKGTSSDTTIAHGELLGISTCCE